MKGLPIKRVLDEETRKQAVWRVVDGEVKIYSLHIKRDEVIITDNEDYDKIYCIYSLEYYQMIERSAR